MDITSATTVIGSIILSVTTLVSAFIAYRKIKFEIGNMKATESDTISSAAKKIAESSTIVLNQLTERVKCLEEDNIEKDKQYQRLEQEYELLRKDHISLRDSYYEVKNKQVELTKENVLYRRWNSILMNQVLELNGTPAPMPSSTD